jgi:hypothetical protein
LNWFLQYFIYFLFYFATRQADRLKHVGDVLAFSVCILLITRYECINQSVSLTQQFYHEKCWIKLKNFVVRNQAAETYVLTGSLYSFFSSITDLPNRSELRSLSKCSHGDKFCVLELIAHLNIKSDHSLVISAGFSANETKFTHCTLRKSGP